MCLPYVVSSKMRCQVDPLTKEAFAGDPGFSSVLSLEAVVVWSCRVLASKIDELGKRRGPNKGGLCVAGHCKSGVECERSCIEKAGLNIALGR